MRFKMKDEDKLLVELQAIAGRLDTALELLEVESGHDTTRSDFQKLKRQLADKQIAWDREKEKWDREKREVEHMVGLQRKRAEQERELAVKHAQLEVREGNLSAKETAFEERLEAITQGLKDQVEYLRTDIIKSILERLPTFKVDTILRQPPALAAANGRHRDVDGSVEDDD